MARFNCFATLLAGKKKRSKDSPKVVDNVKPSTEDFRKPNQFNGPVIFGDQQKDITISVKMVEKEKLARAEVAPEAAYEGGDEQEEVLSMKRDFSDLDLQARAKENEFSFPGFVGSNSELNPVFEKNEERTPEPMIQDGHLSDPGTFRTKGFWGSPKLKRSCSNIETKRADPSMSPVKSSSYNDLRNLSAKAKGGPINVINTSPQSVMTNRSADRVMLKKRSSSQVLPSRSRKLWWKLFLWSHRNLHKPSTLMSQRLVSAHSAQNQKGGYSSDTLEPSSSTRKKNKAPMVESGSPSGLWPQSQWVAFSGSSVDRVNAWVNSLEDSTFGPFDDDDNDDGEGIDANTFPSSPGIGESSEKKHANAIQRVEEIVQANNIIQSLNSFSSVAHICGMGLKVIPAISAFSSLRTVNLSGNSIVHITPGSLPKNLHTLDLSRNKIATIEGLRDLTRLRVLNLSYNRISSIGHGLSSCTLIKELYLSGNKISDIEGLHRLLKLTVLDLSFNKITTAKALGQLVANYNSLLALNLLGNPIQGNIGDDQLRKAVTSLLPQLAYLNKQSIKPQRGREAATDRIAKAALADEGWSSRRRLMRRASQGSGSPVSGRDGSGHRGLGNASVGQKSIKHRSKRGHQHSSPLRK